MFWSYMHRYEEDNSYKNSKQAEFEESKSKAKSKELFIQLITEIKIHKTLKHRRIVGFDHVFEDN